VPDTPAAHTDAAATPASEGAGLAAALEALLLASGKALRPEELWQALRAHPAHPEHATAAADAHEQGHRGGGDSSAQGAPGAIAGLVERLNGELASQGRAARVERVAGGYRLMVAPEHAAVVAAFDRARQPSRLSRAAIETLSIVAYRQPITRAQIEAIRGVACGEVLRALLDRKLIAIKGRADEIGRPILYGTTRQFLDHFGLASLKELPEHVDSTPRA